MALTHSGMHYSGLLSTSPTQVKHDRGWLLYNGWQGIMAGISLELRCHFAVGKPLGICGLGFSPTGVPLCSRL
jgi:hypothetical protein